MENVVIAGIGQTAVAEHWDTSLRELGLYAMEAAMEDAAGLRPSALYVGNMLAATLSHQTHLGALLADFAGLHGIEAAHIEASGASGAMALRMGALAIASKAVDSVMVLGVEKLSDQIASQVEAALDEANRAREQCLVQSWRRQAVQDLREKVYMPVRPQRDCGRSGC